MKIIEVCELSKKYHHHTVLKNVSLSIEKGNCYLLIGNNGAGKSTLIKCLLGITVFKGVIIKRITKMGYVPEKMFLPLHLSVSRFLKEVAYVKGISVGIDTLIETHLKKWNLSDKKDSLIKTLSKGMMQKVSIIQCLMDNNEVIIFDEVLNGLDQENQALLFETIKDLKKQGVTFIVSSHYPKEYLEVVDRVIEIKNKRVFEYDKSVYQTNKMPL